MIYTHVMNKGARGVKSPLDRVAEPDAAYVATPSSTDQDLRLKY